MWKKMTSSIVKFKYETSNQSYNTFSVHHQNTLFLCTFLFLFCRSGKIRRTKVPICHRVCHSWWHHRPPDWLPRPQAAEVERGVNVSPARYMYGCAPLRDQGESLERSEKHQRLQAEQRLGHYTQPTAKQPVRTADPGGLHTVSSSSREEWEKFGEMQSVYQHLISLLFVFSSLQVNQLTEGCSCALTHPQDAFCNSDIGKKWITAVDKPVYYFIFLRADVAE